MTIPASIADAYREAYNVSPDTMDKCVYVNASRIASSTKVRLRLQELRTAEYLSQPWSVDKMRATLEDRSAEAAHAGKYGPSIRALELIGKLDGLLAAKGDAPDRRLPC